LEWFGQDQTDRFRKNPEIVRTPAREIACVNLAGAKPQALADVKERYGLDLAG
jgi:hypothetical protein